MRQSAVQALRGGGKEIKWCCQTCGHTVKLLDDWGRVVIAFLAIALGAAVPWVAFTAKAKESERPWIVLILLVTVGFLVGLFFKDRAERRKHAVVTVGE